MNNQEYKLTRKSYEKPLPERIPTNVNIQATDGFHEKSSKVLRNKSLCVKNRAKRHLYKNKVFKGNLKTPKSKALISPCHRREKSLNLSQLGNPTGKKLDSTFKARSGSLLKDQIEKFEQNSLNSPKKQRNPLLLLQNLTRDKILLEKIIACITDCIEQGIPPSSVEECLANMESHADGDSIIKKLILENVIWDNIYEISTDYNDISKEMIGLCDSITDQEVNIDNFRTFCDFYKVYPEYVNPSVEIPQKKLKNITKDTEFLKNTSFDESTFFDAQVPTVKVKEKKKKSIFRKFENGEIQQLKVSYSTDADNGLAESIIGESNELGPFHSSELRPQFKHRGEKSFDIPRYQNKSVNFGFTENTPIYSKRVHDVNFNYQLGKFCDHF
ncbi:unnamed protein product [Moneuplotes crassus]|uniref:Uncharacterized protein n=1 Tax=Euplotes crassus TaxID=5936 RepID=A0AAD2DBC3_EUPCR|nr:unnamed protein product [Moneuplotes crassus]